MALKSATGVTLSISEGEYVAMSEAIEEIRFNYFVLHDIGIELELPIMMKTDNVGALFMIQKFSAGVRSRHIYLRESG